MLYCVGRSCGSMGLFSLHLSIAMKFSLLSFAMGFALSFTKLEIWEKALVNAFGRKRPGEVSTIKLHTMSCFHSSAMYVTQSTQYYQTTLHFQPSSHDAARDWAVWLAKRCILGVSVNSRRSSPATQFDVAGFTGFQQLANYPNEVVWLSDLYQHDVDASVCPSIASRMFRVSWQPLLGDGQGRSCVVMTGELVINPTARVDGLALG